MLKRKGQTILEYTVILVIILGVLITMRNYVKRGIQGRWKSATDDLGEQYDPQAINSSVNYSTQVNAISLVTVTHATESGQPALYTNRMDTSYTLESKTGFTQVGN